MSHYKPYSNYKNSGVDWLGDVPEHWDARRAKYLFDRKQRAVRDEDEIVTAFRDGQVTLRKNRREDGFTVALKEHGYQGVRKNDLVIHAMDAFAGAVGVSDSDGKCSPVYSCCKAKSGIHPQFYGYLVRTMSTTGFIESLAKGIRERSTDFRWADFSTLELPLPTFEEQEKVVTYLDRETARIDTLIEKKQRQIELLREKRQAIITQAVTKGLDPDVPMKDSGVEWLGEVPEHWEVGKLRWLAKLQGGIAKGRDVTGKDAVTLPYLRVANVQDGYVDLAEVKEITLLKSEVQRYLLAPNDVLMNEGGDNDKLGRGTVWTGQISPCIHQNHVFAVRTEKRLLPEWLALYTRSTSAKAHLFLRSKQSTNLASISASNIMDITVPVPRQEEQEAILGYVNETTNRLDSIGEKTGKSIQLLQERRSALITAAVTGQIDVRGE